MSFLNVRGLESPRTNSRFFNALFRLIRLEARSGAEAEVVAAKSTHRPMAQNLIRLRTTLPRTIRQMMSHLRQTRQKMSRLRKTHPKMIHLKNYLSNDCRHAGFCGVVLLWNVLILPRLSTKCSC